MAQSRERSEKFERGLKTRRGVVGDAYVDKSLAAADDFTWPMQVLVTENCWQDIWNRPGLDKRDDLARPGFVLVRGETSVGAAAQAGSIAAISPLSTRRSISAAPSRSRAVSGPPDKKQTGTRACLIQ